MNYTFSDSDRRADDDWGLGFALGKPITPSLNMELSLTGSSLDFKTGSGEYNLVGLGYDYLVNHGIATDRLTTRGFGQTRPAFSNATNDGRAKNRRVELHIK